MRKSKNEDPIDVDETASLSHGELVIEVRRQRQTLAVLVAAGFVSQDKVDKAREIIADLD